MNNKQDFSNIIKSMSIEEKVAQLFITTPESLAKRDETFTKFDSELEKALSSVPIGGLIYFGRNLTNPQTTSELLNKTQSYSSDLTGLPLFQCIDEEGGRISKVANNSSFGEKNIGPAFELGKTKDTNYVTEKGQEVGHYLSKLGFNVDFAPCADVLSNPKNEVIGNRSFSSNPNTVAELALAFAKGLLTENIIPSFKHFPGHGNTDADSHFGYAYTNKTLSELYECELIPFEKGISEGIPMIMIGHISLPNIVNTNEPASLSEEIITSLLRNQLGFDGVVITDSLKMNAISAIYTSKEAAIKAIVAGSDIILRPADFYEAYYGVIDAVKSGILKESRIDESLQRIFKVKSLIGN